MKRNRCRLLFALVAAIALAAPSFAQQTSGNIAGRVLDPQGAAMPGVTVTARNPETGLTRNSVSDAEGLYRISALPVGTYDLTVELQGFATLEQKGIIVSVGQTVDLNFDLKVAQVSEAVTVTGESPLIETSSSSVGGVATSDGRTRSITSSASRASST